MFIVYDLFRQRKKLSWRWLNKVLSRTVQTLKQQLLKFPLLSSWVKAGRSFYTWGEPFYPFMWVLIENDLEWWESNSEFKKKKFEIWVNMRWLSHCVLHSDLASNINIRIVCIFIYVYLPIETYECCLLEYEKWTLINMEGKKMLSVIIYLLNFTNQDNRMSILAYAIEWFAKKCVSWLYGHKFWLGRS